MSTEKLKRIVRADFESGDSDDAANDEFITRVMEVIAQREGADPTTPYFDGEAGWKDFQQNYCSTGEKSIHVYSDIQQNELVHKHKNEEQADLQAPQSKRAGHGFPRVLAVAAAIICLCAVTARTFEINILNNVCTVDAGYFPIPYGRSFVAGSGVYLRHRAGYQPDVGRRIDGGGHHPARFVKVDSGGFRFSGVKAYLDIGEPMYTALYEDETTDRSTVILSVIVHEHPQAAIQEKGSSQVTMYQSGGIDHSNDSIDLVLWIPADNV